MSVLTEVIDEKKYAGLLSKALPQVIRTEEDNERYIALLESLDDRKHPSAEEKRLAELLTLLIEDFEEKHYALPQASPLAIVHHLMEAQGLRQKDLLDVFGSPSVASEVLSGKRDFSKAHIQKLSSRFHVSPELFFSGNEPETPVEGKFFAAKVAAPKWPAKGGVYITKRVAAKNTGSDKLIGSNEIVEYRKVTKTEKPEKPKVGS